MTTSPPSSDRYSPAEFFVICSTAHPELWILDCEFPKVCGRTEAGLIWCDSLKEARRFTVFTVEEIRAQIVACGRCDEIEVESFDAAQVRTVRLHAKP